MDVISGSGRSPGVGNGNPLQNSCLGKPHGQRSLEGYSPWSYKAKHTEQLKHTHRIFELNIHSWVSFHSEVWKRYRVRFLTFEFLFTRPFFRYAISPSTGDPESFEKSQDWETGCLDSRFLLPAWPGAMDLATGDLSCFNCIIRIINGFSGGKWLPWDLELDLE